ncbi:uncharacterized protein LOC125177784, partial [Hyalella azteca]|uniref:Uncharacterized protein LOC125177784 n=1 Tax=Hyalella azteca TaxID=294128 RepID=A0A979FHC3_HYAAZ
ALRAQRRRRTLRRRVWQQRAPASTRLRVILQRSQKFQRTLRTFTRTQRSGWAWRGVTMRAQRATRRSCTSRAVGPAEARPSTRGAAVGWSTGRDGGGPARARSRTSN